VKTIASSESARTARLPRSEQELIKAAQAGDSTAFDNLVRQYQDYLYRLMVRACHHPQDAEEVASEAFARAYERLCQFEGRSSFVTWLSRIATNLCFRRREKIEIPAVSLDELAAESPGRPDQTPPTADPGPEAHLIQSEIKQLIYAALATIPEPDQTVLRLRDIEELPASEVSVRTGLTVPAVKSRLHRARKALREQLNQYFQIENA
jgi:RNA polymerase sigma-70 factor (ECF subfamily)